MPGIHILYNKNSMINDIDINLDYLKHENDYKVNILIKTDHLFIAYSGYEGYPIKYFEKDGVFYCIEGLIYNKTDENIEKDLTNISSTYIDKNNCNQQIKNFVNDSDGDYLIFIYIKKLDELIIFNDMWGRLPLYYYKDDKLILFSRENSFILENIPSIHFDKNAIAEFLVFEYTLGQKTLVSDIYRAYPSSLFCIKQSPDSISVKTEQLYTLNYDTIFNNISKNYTIKQCASLFFDSLNCRVKKIKEKQYNIIADLSGGYDTRAVFFGLCKLNANVDYYTDYLITGDESEYAKKVADLCSKDVEIINASHKISTQDMCKITYVTGCTVNAMTALSCYQDSIERKKKINNISIKFGGFGGEFIRHPYKKGRGYNSIIDMLKDDIYIRGFNINNACSLLKMDVKSFLNRLSGYFDKYPESNITDKIKHLYFDYYNNLVNLGENRERLHFWNVQPLWSKDMLSFYLRNIPRKYIDYGFFIKFMTELDPKSLNAPIYGSRIILNSKLSVFLFIIKERVKDIFRYNRYLRKPMRYIKKINKDNIKTSANKEKIKDEIIKIYNSSSTLLSYLDKKSIQDFVESEHKKNNLHILLTLELYFSEIEKGFSSKIV